MNEPILMIDAAFRLGCLGKNAIDALPDLIKATNSVHPHVRANVIGAIGRIGEEPGASLPVLFKALNDEYSLVRQYAAAGIGLFHTDDLKRFNTAQELSKYLNDHDPCVRTFITETFFSLQ